MSFLSKSWMLHVCPLARRILKKYNAKLSFVPVRFVNCPTTNESGGDGGGGGRTSVDEFYKTIQPPVPFSLGKIALIGVGNVGMAAAIFMLAGHSCTEIAIVDLLPDIVKGEILDIQHGLPLLPNVHIEATSTDYSIINNSKVVILCAGAKQTSYKSRLERVGANVDIFKQIVPKVKEFCPNAILLVASNPVDIMTYITQKLSGFPAHKVIGTGTHLDTARFRWIIAQKLGIIPQVVNALIIGEHGDSCVPCWSKVDISGVLLREVNPQAGLEGDPENWGALHQAVIKGAYEVIKLRGHTKWAVALCIDNILRRIMTNANTSCTVSTRVQGFYGIEEDVCLSLPATIGEDGITRVAKLRLDCHEEEALRKSAKFIYEVQKGVSLN